MQNKFWNYIKDNKLVNALNLFLLIILIVPYSYTYCGIENSDELGWNVNYVTDGSDLPFLYGGIVFLTLLFQIIQHKKIRQVLLIFLLLVTLAWFYLIFVAIFTDNERFISGMASYLSLLLFPLTLIMLFFKKK